jgi:phytanoyl-CoA hydroxylase
VQRCNGGGAEEELLMSMTADGPELIAKRLYRYERVYEALANPAAFDAAAERRYLADGFIAIENVFTPGEIDSAMAGVAALIAEGDPRIISFEDGVDASSLSPSAREAAVRKCMGFVEREGRLAAIARKEGFLNVVRRLLGSEVALLQDMALLKPPFIGREKPWHQDGAYFQYGPPDRVIGTWIALDAASASNGCMHVIPGSHLRGPKPHYHDRDCQLRDETIEVDEDVVVPLAPGGVLFFHGLLHHGTPPNRSSERRRAVQYHYRSVNARKLSLEENRAMFHDEQGWAACNGWSYDVAVREVASARGSSPRV